MAVIADTSALLALADAADAHHEQIRDRLEHEHEVAVVPQTVLCEVSHLLARRFGARAERRFLVALRDGNWRLESMQPSDLARSIELLERYEEDAFGFVDASTIAIAERLAVRRIYTLDRRDFARVKPRHIAAFEIVP